MAYATHVRSSAKLVEHAEKRVLKVLIGLSYGRRRVIWLLTCVVALSSLLAVACGADGTQGGPGPVGSVGSVDLVGDDERAVPGSGELTTDIRQIADFDRLVFSSEGTVVLTQAATVSMSIEAHDNLHQYLTTDISDGELTIGTVQKTNIAPSEPIVFRVGVAELRRLELAGVGTVTADTLDGAVLEVVLIGTGDLIISQLQADQVTVDHGGVGTIRLTGEADQQRVLAFGVGEYDGTELVSRKAKVEASGSAKVIVHVTDDLEIDVSESGAVAFYGSPRVEQEISGSGTVTPLGPR